MEQFNTIPTSGNWSDIAGIIDANFLRCWTALVQSQSLIGLDGSNYMGMYTSESALPEMTEAGWALVGSSLSALQLYVFNDGATDWALFSNETYNFTSWTEFQTQLDALSTQVATIGLKLGDLANLQTTEKSNLVGAINEIKEATEDLSGDAGDINYTDNQGLGSTNVQGALDELADRTDMGDNEIFTMTPALNSVTTFADSIVAGNVYKIVITNVSQGSLVSVSIGNTTTTTEQTPLHSTSVTEGMTVTYTPTVNATHWRVWVGTASSTVTVSQKMSIASAIENIEKELDIVNEELSIPKEFFDISKANVSSSTPNITIEKTDTGFVVECATVANKKYAYCSIPNLVIGENYKVTFDFTLTGESTSASYPYLLTIYSKQGGTYLGGVTLQRIGMSGSASITFTPTTNETTFRMAANDMAVDGNKAEISNISVMLQNVEPSLKTRVTSIEETIDGMNVSLSTANGGLRWHQGGVNGNTGKVENNMKAIHTDFIKVYADDEFSALSYTNTVANNLAYAVFDDSFQFKNFLGDAASINTYIGTGYGYVKLVFYGSYAIDKESDNAVSAVWNIKRTLRSYVIEKEVRYIQNPLYTGDCPDPCIINGGDGYWYCFHTIGTTGKFLRSANLTDWEEGEAFLSDSAIETLSALDASFWAPEVKKIGDFWTMYISAATKGMFVLKSRNIWGKYEVVNNISSSLTTTTQRIDACVEYDENGQLWLFWGSIGGVCRARLNDDGTDFLDGETPEKITPTSTSNANGWEGTYLYRRNGYWYLFSSNGNYRNYTYNVRVVRSATLDGSFVDKDGNTFLEGNSTRVLYSENGDEIYGPGHNGAIVVDKDNRTWMFFHAHILGDTDHQSTRGLYIGEVLWDEDGWPYFEGGKPSIKLIERPTF